MFSIKQQILFLVKNIYSKLGFLYELHSSLSDAFHLHFVTYLLFNFDPLFVKNLHFTRRKLQWRHTLQNLPVEKILCGSLFLNYWPFKYSLQSKAAKLLKVNKKLDTQRNTKLRLALLVPISMFLLDCITDWWKLLKLSFFYLFTGF